MVDEAMSPQQSSGRIFKMTQEAAEGVYSMPQPTAGLDDATRKAKKMNAST